MKIKQSLTIFIQAQNRYNYEWKWHWCLAGSSYIRLPKELDHPRKGLINIQNTGNNECFKWSIVTHLNSANHHPARILKADRDFTKKLDFKDKISSKN